MELDKIKELIEMMEANDLSELEIVDGQTRIKLKRGASQGPPQMVAMPQVVPAGGAVTNGGEAVAGGGAAGAAEAAAKEDDNLIEIVAPMVGTFYPAPSPNAEPFVEVGAKVTDESVVCIIEAMKVMNEIKSEVKGTIKKVLVSNGQAVEYGQALFLVEPE